MVIFKPYKSVINSNNSFNTSEIINNAIKNENNFYKTKCNNISCEEHPNTSSIIIVYPIKDGYKLNLESYCCNNFKTYLENNLPLK